jgi:hypothetical protein
MLRVSLSPRVGGTIDRVEHKLLGASVLGTTPWRPQTSPIASGAAADEQSWLTRYGGGWPILFPSGGDACVFEGVVHGFHGEASISPWEAEVEAGVLRLWRRFNTVPVEMTRHIAVEGELLSIRERLKMLGERPIRVMWGHHPTFGSDLLDGPFGIQCGARRATVDALYDPPSNPLQPGATGAWPWVPGKSGPFDLGRPQGKMAALAYLQGFASPWAAIRRLDNSLAAVLSWDSRIFPNAWLWYELGGTLAPPWNGQTRLIGVEPNTTIPAAGLAEAARRGGRLLTLAPGEEVGAIVRLHVLRPTGPIRGVDAAGRAVMAG